MKLKNLVWKEEHGPEGETIGHWSSSALGCSMSIYFDTKGNSLAELRFSDNSIKQTKDSHFKSKTGFDSLDSAKEWCHNTYSEWVLNLFEFNNQN